MQVRLLTVLFVVFIFNTIFFAVNEIEIVSDFVFVLISWTAVSTSFISGLFEPVIPAIDT